MVLAIGLGDEDMKIETAVYCFFLQAPLCLFLLNAFCNFVLPWYLYLLLDLY